MGKILAEQFPEYDLETIDVVDDILRKHKFVTAINVVLTVLRYGWGIVCRHREFRDYFYRTAFIFHSIKRLVAKKLEPRAEEFAFSFQTQSLYDARISGVPHFVYTDHTHLANLYYPGFSRRWLCSPRWIELEKTIYEDATKLFVMSRQVARSITEHYACRSAKVACVYAGYNFDLKPLPLRNEGYTNRQILFVGVDWERKGGPELVAAFQIVQKTIPDARLVIVGVSPQIDVPNCEVIGRVPLEKMQEHFIASSVFCMPSKVEPLGIACIEAFMNKIPVVATRINALADMVEDDKSGYLVEPGDVAGLAAALTGLLSNPEKCRRFGEHGYNAMQDRYSWEAVGRKIRSEIIAALPQSRPSSSSAAVTASTNYQ